MTQKPGALFFAESVCAVASAVFAVNTLVWRDWIELTLRVDPDHHNGSLEWLIAFGLLALAFVLGTMARREWRRCAVRPEAGAA
jgi:hypothetical protein